MKKKLLFLISSALLISFSGCWGIRGSLMLNPYADKDVYTKVNMRYDNERLKGNYIAYKKLTLLPANSKVRILEVKTRGFLMEIPSGEIIEFHYAESWGRKTMSELLPVLLSTTDITSELSKFDANEMKGIKEGRALVGMSKKAVVVALGPPAAHRTHSLEENIWVYWQSTLITYWVKFKDDKVIAVGGAGR